MSSKQINTVRDALKPTGAHTWASPTQTNNASGCVVGATSKTWLTQQATRSVKQNNAELNELPTQVPNQYRRNKNIHWTEHAGVTFAGSYRVCTLGFLLCVGVRKNLAKALHWFPVVSCQRHPKERVRSHVVHKSSIIVKHHTRHLSQKQGSK